MPSGARKARGAGPRRDATSGVCKWSEAGSRRLPPGADGDGPRRQGAQRSLPVVHGAVRGSRCPGAGGGPVPLGVHPSCREAFAGGRDWSLGRSPLPLTSHFCNFCKRDYPRRLCPLLIGELCSKPYEDLSAETYIFFLTRCFQR